MPKRYLGFHEIRDLPFCAGQEIYLPAGAEIMSMNPAHRKVINKRRRRIKVARVTQGQSMAPAYNRRKDFPDHARHYFDMYEEMLLDAQAEPDQEASTRKYKEAQTFRAPTHNPEIVWVGRGGYWCHVDINEFLDDPANMALLNTTKAA